MIAMRRHFSVLVLVAAGLSGNGASAQEQVQELSRAVMAKAVPTTRVTAKIDETRRTTLKGHVPLAVRGATDLGRLDPGTRLDHMLMVLQPSSDQEHALRTLIDSQHDKTTPGYHKWETPDTFQNKFGVSSSDIATVNAWLQQKGFTVEKNVKGGLLVQFSGTVGSFESAFQTEFHNYQVGTAQHISINSDLSIPEALSPVIRAVPTVHNFFKKSSITPMRTVQLKKTAGGRLVPAETQSATLHYVTPGDLAVIYNTTPLLNAGITGSGVTIGIVGRTDIGLNDVQTFRELFGLPTNNPNFIVVGADPGVSFGDDIESDLDVEISGGMAPNATVDFVTSKATLTVDGVDLSSIYIVENNLTDIISESYGECEADEGSAGIALETAIREQATAQGISFFVSTSDSGPAACDSSSASFSTDGYAVSGDASTPYNVAVGGSEFSEGTGTANYWAASNGPGFVSALSYIPETPWNESKSATCPSGDSCSGLASGAGGISAYFATPSWQRGSGVYTTDPPYLGFNKTPDPATPIVAGPHRYLPDVSLNAASGHDALLFCSEGICEVATNDSGFLDAGLVGGTSVSAPSMAGLQALINQANGGRQGLPTYEYYGISANNATAGLACGSAPNTTLPAAGCGFHDINTGNILVCAEKTCTTNTYTDEIGWMATAGYDLATGLGSPNAYQLATQWPTISFTSSVTSLAIPTVGATHGSPTTLTVTVASGSGNGTPTGDVAFLTSSGAITTPVNEDVGDFTNQGPLCTLSGGTCTIQLASLPAGSTSVIARYAGDGTYGSSTSAPVPVAISSESSVVSLTPNSLSCTTGQINPASSFSYGSLIFLDGNVAGASGQGVATGTLSITIDGNPLTTQPLNATGDVEMVSGVIASSSCVFGYSYNNIAALPTGTHVLSASYSGDSNYAASTLASPVTITVSPATLTASLKVTSTEIAASSPATLILTLTPLTAAALPVAPTGTVTYVDTTTSTTLASGVPVASGLYANAAVFLATYTTSGLSTTGAHSITATYSGDANYASVSATGTVTVGGTALGANVLTSTATSFALATTNTLTATLTPPSGGAAATGTVFFFDGSTEIGSSTVSSGKATLSSAKLLAVGTHSITANYAGSTTYSALTSSPLTITVTPATPTMTMSSLAISTVGAPVTLTSVFSATTPTAALADFIPTGGVEFFDGSTAITAPIKMTTVPAADGYGVYQATTTLSNFTAGVHVLTAELIDPNYTAAASYVQTLKVYGKPLGNLERAFDSTTFSTTIPQTDSLYVGGWAADAVDGSSLASVKVYIDGVLAGSATTGLSRPDVASYYNNSAYGTSGYSFTESAASLSAGTHAVTVVATDTGGQTTTFGPLSITVTAVYQAPVGNLEQAIDSSTLSTTIPQTDTLFVSGWAADPLDGSPLSNVKVYIDGNLVGTPTLGVARPDVASATGNSSYANSGYTFTYAVSTLSVGSHSVTVIAINSHGVATTFGPLTISVTAAPNKPPVGNLELAVDSVTGTNPVHQSDSLFVSGWAADYQDNGAAKSVQVFIDGNLAGSATLGISRPDVASYYNNPAWSTTGWQFVIPASGLSVGTHSVTAVATDSLSLTTTLGPLTINVQP